jgi:Flp pilus assembly protein TadB
MPSRSSGASSRRQARRDEPVRITTAPTSRADDLAGRQRRYLLSMALRVVCFVGAVAVGPGWLRWVLVVGAVFLPWIAVVAANAAGGRGGEVGLRESGLGTHAELDPPSARDPHREE